jgi:hypothetical protein
MKFSIVLVCWCLIFSACKQEFNELDYEEMKSLVKCDSLQIELLDSANIKGMFIEFKGGPVLNNHSVASEDLSAIAALLFFQKQKLLNSKEDYDFVNIKFKRDTGEGLYTNHIRYAKKDLALIDACMANVISFNDAFIAKDYTKMYMLLEEELKTQLVNVANLKNVCTTIDSVASNPRDAILYGFKLLDFTDAQHQKGKLIMFKTEVKRDSSITNIVVYINPSKNAKHNIVGLKF